MRQRDSFLQKPERKSFSREPEFLQGNNYAASWRAESKGYPLMMIEFFLLLPPEFYREVQMRSFPCVSLHHCPSYAGGR